MAEVIFPKPCYVEEGGNASLLSLNTSRDCSRNENYCRTVRHSERLRSISVHKTAGKETRKKPGERNQTLEPWSGRAGAARCRPAHSEQPEETGGRFAPTASTLMKIDGRQVSQQNSPAGAKPGYLGFLLCLSPPSRGWNMLRGCIYPACHT